MPPLKSARWMTALVDTVTTDKYGRVFLPLEDGAYYAVEIEAPEGYKPDDTPHYFEVKDGKTSKLTIANTAMSPASSSTRPTAAPARASTA